MNYLRWLIPLGLGLAAGVINFYVMWSLVSPVELVVVKEDVKAGTELTEEMLGKLAVHVEDSKKFFRSAVPYADRGTSLLHLRAKRDLKKDEVVFFDDVWRKGGRVELPPGEASLTLNVRPYRMPPNLDINDTVILILHDEPPKGRPGLALPPDAALDGGGDKNARKPAEKYGPFRVVGLGD